MAKSENTITAEELREARGRVSMGSAEHLIRWMLSSGRGWVFFKAEDLIRALPWPGGVEAFQQMVDCYADHRSVIPTGRTEEIEGTVVPIFKTDVLEDEEIIEAIRFLLNELRSRGTVIPELGQ